MRPIDLRNRPLNPRGAWVTLRHGDRIHRRALPDTRSATVRAAIADTIGGTTGSTVARRWVAAETLDRRAVSLDDRLVSDDRGRLWKVEVRRAETVTRRGELTAVLEAIDGLAAQLRSLGR